MVFCRNLLIYLDAPARAAAFASIGRLLADGGLLFLGHADRPDDSPGSPFRRSRARGASPTARARRRAPGPGPPEAAPPPVRRSPGRRGAGRSRPRPGRAAAPPAPRPRPAAARGGRAGKPAAAGEGRARPRPWRTPRGWRTGGSTTRRAAAERAVPRPGPAPGRTSCWDDRQAAATPPGRGGLPQGGLPRRQHDKALLALACWPAAGATRPPRRSIGGGPTGPVAEGGPMIDDGAGGPGVDECWQRIGVNGDRPAPSWPSTSTAGTAGLRPGGPGVLRAAGARGLPRGVGRAARPAGRGGSDDDGVAAGLPARPGVDGHGALGGGRGDAPGRSTGSRTGPTACSPAWSASGASSSSASRSTACSRSTRPTPTTPPAVPRLVVIRRGPSLGLPGRGGRRGPARRRGPGWRRSPRRWPTRPGASAGPSTPGARGGASTSWTSPGSSMPSGGGQMGDDLGGSR